MRKNWRPRKRWGEYSPGERSQKSWKHDAEKLWSRDDRQTKLHRGKDTSWRGIHERERGELVLEFDPRADYSKGRESSAYHWSHVAKRMKKWHLANHFPTDLEPYELSDETLESFFAGARPKPLQYFSNKGVSDPKDPPEKRIPRELCVRVNVKVGPIDTKIGTPNELSHWVKAALTQRKGSSTWELIEDREECNLISEFSREDDVRRALSFLQPPRKTEDAV